eukprot:2904119-Rhodomonas_salina.2
MPSADDGVWAYSLSLVGTLVSTSIDTGLDPVATTGTSTRAPSYRAMPYLVLVGGVRYACRRLPIVLGISGPDVIYAAIVSFAISGTEKGYAATRLLCDVRY